MLGFSARHGEHHEAQKSINVTFPSSFFNDMVLPSGVGPEKSTVFWLGLQAFLLSVLASFFPILVSFKSASKPSKIFFNFILSAVGALTNC